MGIPVVWLNYTNAPTRGYWDQGMLEDMFANRMWPSGYEFEHYEGLELSLLGSGRGAVIVFAARNQVQDIDSLNHDISKLDWVILMLTGDEEAVFPIEKISHPNIRIWVMSPRPNRHAAYGYLGTGYPPQMRQYMSKTAPEKSLGWFFAGQITHQRREDMAVLLRRMTEGEFHPSSGFTQGLEHADYYAKLASAKVAPCPSGPCTPDSFRLFEALESGCAPIADTRVNDSTEFADDYWTKFFGEEPPFTVLRDYVDLPALINGNLAQYPTINNRIFNWWQRKKREFVHEIRNQIHELSGTPPVFKSDITVLMPSSPVKSHPSTEMIEQTIRDIRVQLPDSEIIILQDGVRAEDEHHRKDYEEYQRRLLWLCNYQWENVWVLRFEDHRHQSGMTREALKHVTTPLILFAEHDTPLTPDMLIEWDKIREAILSGQANVVKFHQEALILPEHEHLMLGDAEEVCGAKMRKSYQWSQRPHLTSTAFYRKMLSDHFSETSRAFIEHGLYGLMIRDVQNDGILGWQATWRYYIYTPDGEHIKRSYDLNGRDGETVYESTWS